MSDTNPIRILKSESKLVAPETLKLHERNPNEGDVGAVIESFSENGFYGRVIVDARTREVLAGNHRVRAAVQLMMPEIPADFVTTDGPEHSLKIMLADNRTTRLGRDDENVLAEILAELANSEAGLVGTGYDEDDLQQLIDDLAGNEARGAAEEAGQDEARKTLAERFGVPPFSVLDARQGYWQDRKRAWLALGIQSELGRGGDNGGTPPIRHR